MLLGGKILYIYSEAFVFFVFLNSENIKLPLSFEKKIKVVYRGVFVIFI